MERIRSLFIVIVLIFSAVNANCQDDHFVSNLGMEEVNQMYLISWTLDSGQTCQGQTIWHSYNGVDYEVAGEIYGICGSLSKSKSYSFTHENPTANSVNYYRIELGGYGSTPPVSAYLIKLDTGNSLVYPNPSNSLIHIKWNNSNNQDCVITFFDKSGKLVLEKQTNENEVNVNVDNWVKGNYTYAITVSQNTEQIVGKIIVD